jgi:hypothetical protein
MGANPLLGLLLMTLLQAQPSAPPGIVAIPKIEKAQPDDVSGQLWVTVGGRNVKVAASAVKFWVLAGKREIVYSGTDGAGGFENEGQSLWSYARAGKSRKLLAEKYVIEDVKEFVTAAKRGLLVSMRDGGLGASHVAVVDPARGEVFSASQARILSADAGTLRLGFYREGDWEKLNSGTSVAPFREQRYDLNQLLSRPVMTIR